LYRTPRSRCTTVTTHIMRKVARLWS
jgi:hypothetical protein